MRTIGRSAEHQDRGGLYHVEAGDAIYFLSFHAKPGEKFSPAERQIVLASCRWGHPERWILYGAIVMPDHVHLLLKPQPIQQCAPEVRRASEDDNSSGTRMTPFAHPAHPSSRVGSLLVKS